jgi:hypothetical protein
MVKVDTTVTANTEANLPRTGLLRRVKESTCLPGEEILSKLDALHGSIEADFFQMGALLKTVRDGELYKAQKYSTFTGYVAGRFGFSTGKALYLIDIYQHLVENVSDEETIEKLLPLGRSRLKMLVPILNRSNAAEWTAKCACVSVNDVARMVAEVTGKKKETAKKKRKDQAANSMPSELTDAEKEVVKEASQLAKLGEKDSLFVFLARFYLDARHPLDLETSTGRRVLCSKLQALEEEHGLNIHASKDGVELYGESEEYVEA